MDIVGKREQYMATKRLAQDRARELEAELNRIQTQIVMLNGAIEAMDELLAIEEQENSAKAGKNEL